MIEQLSVYWLALETPYMYRSITLERMRLSITSCIVALAQLTCNNTISQARAEIYPNPYAENLKIIGYNLLSKNVKLEIYDNASKLHLRQYISLNEIIDISHFK